MFCKEQFEKGEGTGLQSLLYYQPLNAISISGRSGCGNTTVNQLVAEQLGFEGINYTMRNYAQELGISMEEVAQRAQREPEIDCLIDRRQVGMCLKGQVVLSSRLAIWLLPQATLKVYLYASYKVRSQRIQQREGGSLQEQLNRTQARDAHDAQRYRKLYQIDTDDFFFADLIINTETFDQHQVANMIVQAYQLQQNQPRAKSS